MPKNELFIGSLSKDCRRQDLEETFSKYGKLTRCDIKYSTGNSKSKSPKSLFRTIKLERLLYGLINIFKAYSGTAYGFVGFEDERDAEVC